MKYMVMTTRHHEGFSLWDSKANPYNSVNLGPRRDIVQEFVDACREYDLRIGFYSSLMDWHHPDGWTCAYDTGARARFTQYIEALNTELLTQYGKIDILWYDVPMPMKSWEGWDSLERNQRLRALQPDLIINNRSRLGEDFGTPEENIQAQDNDWEACMTFNGISWCYTDSDQVIPYSYNQQGILDMLRKVCAGGGNLLLNIGPTPDGSVPAEAVAPLTAVGQWLQENGEAVYGIQDRTGGVRGNGGSAPTRKGNTVYLWHKLWPKGGEMGLGGYLTPPRAVRLLRDGTALDFEHRGHRILLRNLTPEMRDPHAGVTVIALDYDEAPEFRFASYYPQFHGGHDITGGQRV